MFVIRERLYANPAESWNLTDGFEFSLFFYFLYHSLKQNLKNTSENENKSNLRDVYNSQH
jgi:hypothetical protein